ncbi:MAG: amidohydrolase [Bacteroidetes bacterium]|nr:MAG: amidohydrolase [Bacteroidota bacterium]
MQQMRNFIFLLSATFFSITISAQTPAVPSSTFPVNGTIDKHIVKTVLEHATIHVDANTVLEDATLVLFRGQIEAINPLSISGPAVRLDLSGYHLYPSFVDLHSSYGLPKVKPGEWSRTPQYESNVKGAYGWNQAIRPEIDAAQKFVPNAKSAKLLREAGFGAVLTHVPDGIVRGTGALVMPVDDARQAVLRPLATSHFSFRKGSSRQSYPSSLMGATALLRQTFYDAVWYESASKLDLAGGTNLSLEAYNSNLKLPAIFSAGSWKDILRAEVVADELNLDYILLGGGDGYKRADAIKAEGSTLIVPVNFPEPYDLSDPYLARFISLAELKHWELAPSNAFILNDAGVPFCFTSQGLKSPLEFLPAVRKAVERGLPESVALAAMTSIPADLIGASNLLGSIKVGLKANVLVTDGPIFEEETKLIEHWVSGTPTIIFDRDAVNISGEYNISIGGGLDGGESSDKLRHIKVTGAPGKVGTDKGWTATHIVDDTTSHKVSISLDNRTIVLGFETDEGPLRLTGNVWMDSRIWEGAALSSEGKWVSWSAVKSEDKSEDKTEDKSELAAMSDSSASKSENTLGQVFYPFTAYGSPETNSTLDQTKKAVVIRGAVVWTCEDEGILEEADVLLYDGKILGVGARLNVAELLGSDIEVEEINGRGMHVTPGIIDEHSHIAIERGVNESTQASSAEVWIGHSLNSEDVNIYRQLAGGVTCAQLLHGSANPIGGQSAIIKFRWGSLPTELLYESATPFIKFALGENVKQSNWGDAQKVRFPQSRMGVEQVYYDHFIRAREYGESLIKYRHDLSKTSRRTLRAGLGPIAPRRDIELETLLQILNEERFVTCHSYRQDEINMLMHVADSMNFRLNTFTHILEGYKVADKMKKHGAGGSSFSDWWAYKYEVKDAIPYNGAILYDMGITTAFNSDDAEMARRLNQEAAKAVKYGSVPEEEALKFVTLNPAKLLHIDHLTGSIKVGKDADIVVWDDNPLSMNARAVRTYVEGECLFSLERDEELRELIKIERARLTEKMIAASSGSGAGSSKKALRIPSEVFRTHYHCDTVTEENN